jgi:hypothetical protein
MELKEVVKEKYGQAALRVSTGGGDPITSNLYDAAQSGELPQGRRRTGTMLPMPPCALPEQHRGAGSPSHQTAGASQSGFVPSIRRRERFKLSRRCT